MVTDAGYPNRTFFELFDGACNGKTADKIYSIQVADWKKYFVDSAGNYVPTAAVVDEDATDQSLVNRGDHLRVIPTNALVDFLQTRGVTLNSAVYVTPLAFDWKDQAQADVFNVKQINNEKSMNTNVNLNSELTEFAVSPSVYPSVSVDSALNLKAGDTLLKESENDPGLYVPITERELFIPGDRDKYIIIPEDSKEDQNGIITAVTPTGNTIYVRPSILDGVTIKDFGESIPENTNSTSDEKKGSKMWLVGGAILGLIALLK